LIEGVDKIIKIELTAKANAIENIPEFLRHIASLVEEGSLSSDYPKWDLEIKEVEENPGEL
jgi:hypothetical protein